MSKYDQDIWMVEHPCDASVKKQAQKAGCRVVDIRYANAFPPERVKKVIKKEVKTASQPAV